MPRVTIKHMDNLVATRGLHLGGPRTRRKLFPGEVVEIPEDFMEAGRPLIDILWETGKLEISLDPVNRPLEYENERIAQLTAPTFKPRGPDEVRQVEQAFAQVEASLSVEDTEPVSLHDDEPATVEPPTPPIEEPAAAPPEVPPVRNPRAERRAALKQAQQSEALSG